MRRTLSVVILAVVLIAPIQAASDGPPLLTGTKPGPGWISMRLQLDANYSLEFDMIRYVSDPSTTAVGFAWANEAGVVDGMLIGVWTAARGYDIRASGTMIGGSLDLRSTPGTGTSIGTGLRDSCGVCGERERILIAFFAGDIHRVDWSLGGSGVRVIASATGDEAHFFDEQDFGGELNVNLGSGGSVGLVLGGSIQLDAARPLLGTFSPGQYAIVAEVEHAEGIRADCECAFWGDGPTGLHEFRLTRVGRWPPSAVFVAEPILDV